jgi:hypothetical protein
MKLHQTQCIYQHDLSDNIQSVINTSLKLNVLINANNWNMK